MTFLNNIGLVHQHHKNLDKSIEYFSRGLKLAEEINNQPGIAMTLNNMGASYEQQKNYDQALTCFKRCLEIRNSLGEQLGQISVLANIGSVYQRKGDLKQAMDFQMKSLKIAEEIGYGQGIASVLNNIGSIYLLQGKVNMATEYSEKSLAKAKDLGAIIEIRAAAESLHKVYQQSGKYQASLEMYKLFDQMRDSIANIDGQKEALQQEFKRKLVADSLDFARQRELDVIKHKAEQQKANTQKIFMLVGFVLVLLAIGVYIRIVNIKKVAEQKNLLQEIKLLKIEAVVKTAAIPSAKQLTLDKEKIESAINNSLNPSDWNILNALYDNPAIGNKQLADAVSLSVAGVRSSLQKMYRFFYIDQSNNQRMLLVMEATKISNKS